VDAPTGWPALHDSVCCALNRDIFLPGPGPDAAASADCCCCCGAARPLPDSRTKLEVGSTVGGRVGLRGDGKDGESIIAIGVATPACGGGKDGESTTIEPPMSAGAGCGRLRSNTVSLVGSSLGAERRASSLAIAPSRGPSLSSARVRGGAAVRTTLNFEFFCWRAGAVLGTGAGVGAAAEEEAEA